MTIAERRREFATEVVRRLRDAGFESLWAGGCVRDLLLGLAPNDYDIATAATLFPAGADVNDPNLVKVVTREDGRALYFSRSPIPFWRDLNNPDNSAYHLHLGIYAYRWQFLKDFSTWPQSALEKTEKLEQLRALEHGRSIFVLKVDRATHGIDTPEQYADFVKRYKQH